MLVLILLLVLLMLFALLYVAVFYQLLTLLVFFCLKLLSLYFPAFETANHVFSCILQDAGLLLKKLGSQSGLSFRAVWDFILR